MKRLYPALSAASLVLLLSACSTLGMGSAPTANSASSSSGNSTPSAAGGATPAHKSAPSSAGTKSAAQVVHPTKIDAAASAPPSKAEQLLADGTDLYDNGDFKGAIKKLQAARDAFNDTSTNMQDSLKYLAFSYCVTGQRAMCKAQFVALLKISPEFVLSRAEVGHPLWGPVFKEARAGVKVAATSSGFAK